MFFFQDRRPWLESLHNIIDKWVRHDEHGIIGCSALKKIYRDILVGNTEYKPLGHCVLVLLKGTKEVIASRMKEREHFMPISLLESQIDALELPAAQETSIVCDVQQSLQEIVSKIVREMESFL